MHNLILLVLMALMSNAPWLSDRHWFGLLPKTQHPSLWLLHKITEWLTLFVLFLWLSAWYEGRVMGVTHSQAWEFYAVMLLLFLLLSTPLLLGRFVAKQFRRKSSRR